MKQLHLKASLLFACIITCLVLITITASSCGTINNAVDSIEQPSRLYWNETKAVFVIKCQGKYVYCTNPTGTRYYRIKDKYGRINTDTVLLAENKWVYNETKFIKQIPE